MKDILLRGILIAIPILLAFGAYVRFAPTDADRWHVDPESAPSPGRLGVQLAADDSAVWSAPPETVLQALKEVADETPRTTLLAGSAGDGMITFVTRTRLWGFPDFTTIRAIPDGEGTRLAILARGRFGDYDLGVNAARVEAWLAALANRVARR